MRMRLCNICSKVSFYTDLKASSGCPHCGYSFDAKHGFERVEKTNAYANKAVGDRWSAALDMDIADKVDSRFR